MGLPSRILIYGLISPIDNCLFYVGRTKKRREFRLLEHIEEAVKGTKTPVYSEIRRYMFQGGIPRIFIIEKVIEIEKADLREKYWINWFLNKDNYELPLILKAQTQKSENTKIYNVNITNVRK